MNSTLYRTTGIVLSHRDHKEADRWYSIFTPHHGKIEFVARGGHKPLAKLTPHLEMMAVIELLLVRGRAYHIVAGVERTKAFGRIYHQLPNMLLAQNGLHLVDIGTRPQENDPSVYVLLHQWLEFLDSHVSFSQERAGFLLGAFTLKLMSLIGYRPELNNCLSCRGAIHAGNFGWHALKGGVVCMNCMKKDEAQWFSARSIMDDVLKLLRFGLHEPFEVHLRTYLPGKDLSGFHEAVESLIVSHFPTIPASSLRSACEVC